MVVLLLGVMDRNVLPGLRPVQDGREIQLLRLPVLDTLASLQLVCAADHLFEGPNAELGHELPDLLGTEEEVVDDVLGRPGEAPPELRVLGGDPYRAGIEVAYPHHDAARSDQRSRREGEFLCA